MEATVQRFRQLATRVRSRVVFPALGVAVALSTVAVGLQRTSYLTKATGAEELATAGSTVLRSDVSIGDVLGASSKAEPGSPADFDVDVQHARVDQWVERLTTSLRGDFAQSLQRMDRYEQMILAKLDARQMPHELVYLAMIESNFNPTARSRVSAVGLWQFMSGTARQFGLRVGRKTDERKNPAKSTDAALAYLSQLHDRFGSWYLAAAAYNSGQGTVSKALMKVTGKTTGTDEDFFRIMPALPKETQDYVPKLIATARVGSNPEKYGM
jgi:membrane-bound lytic murein transglycosylase D